MDPVDEQLLDLLKADGRASTADLARRMGVARSTVQSRMARLEEKGVIGGYTVRPGPASRAPMVRALVMIRVDPAKARPVETTLRNVRGVVSLYSASGGYDLIALVSVETTQRLDEDIDHIRDVEGVSDTHTAILLSTKFER